MAVNARLELLVSDDPGLGESSSWSVGDCAVLGRDPAADITINLAPVSRRHCQIERRSNGWWLLDLDSSNGTWVNGDRVNNDARALRDNDELVIAGSVTLRFRDPMATPITPAIGKLTGIWIDPDSHRVWLDAAPLEPPLSARQLDLLELLYDASGNIVDRRTIVDVVWADVAYEGVSDEAVSALIKRLRQRLKPQHGTHEFIDIVRGRGVRLINP